jgi:murein DD-endopeptidase MepM/ murein hydrolase activator NlpD
MYKRRLVSIMNPKQLTKRKRIGGAAILILVLAFSMTGMFTVYAHTPAPAFTLPIAATEGVEYVNPAPGHAGMDILAPEGTAVLAAADGTVSKVVTDGKFGYGNYLIVDHDGFQTLYGHNKEIFVSEGDTVAQGEHLAEVGRSGTATDYMLHFEILEVK